MEIKLTKGCFLYRKRLLLIIMRTFIFLCCATVFALTPNNLVSQNSKIKIVAEESLTVDEVFDLIMEQTEYKFFYEEGMFTDFPKVQVQKGSISTNRLLKKSLAHGNLSIQVTSNNAILINEKSPDGEQEDKEKKEIQLNISGTIIDENGTPLSGANILEKSTANGTQADFDGNFSLTVANENSILTVSYLGFQTQEVVVGSQTIITITLQEDASGLDEVIVVGYGVKKKGELTGAISKVDSEVFRNRPLNNSMDALQGRIPGVTISKGNGRPGDGAYQFQIRGFSSINGNSPLILIDGVPGDMNSINPDDIENVTVLKDAAAAIYGSRAADGVILITSKTGKTGVPVVQYSANFGVKIPHYLPKKASTLQLAEMLDEGYKNIGQAGIDQEVFDKIRARAEYDMPADGEPTWHRVFGHRPNFYENTDFIGIYYGNSMQQRHNLSVSGGGDNSKYLLSLGYSFDEGIFKFGKNQSDSYNIRLNYDFKLSDRLNLETKTSFRNNTMEEPSMMGEILGWAPMFHSWVPMYNLKGNYFAYQTVWSGASILEEGGNRTKSTSSFSTNFKADYEILPGFIIVGQVAIGLEHVDDNAEFKTWTDYDYFGGVYGFRNVPNNAEYYNRKNVNKILTAYVDYSKEISEKHRFNLMAGASHEENDYENEYVKGYNFISNEVMTLNLADKTKLAYFDIDGRKSDWALKSYFSRLSYTFNNKIFIDLTARADGSSKFASDKRWSKLFPSAAVAYNIGRENFIENLNIFDFLKIRASWGQTGNQDIGALGLYDYAELIKIQGQYPIGSPNAGLPGAVSSVASSDRTWETIENKNIGLNMTVLNNRLSFVFDLYEKQNKNMLVDLALPQTFGATPPSQNQGRLVTKGFETSITWSDKVNDDFKYSVSAQLNDSKNTLVELKNSDNYSEGLNFAREGYPINSYFGFVFDGLIRTQGQLDAYKNLEGVPSNISLGDVMYKDVDGDGKITRFGDPANGTQGDMEYLGNSMPRYNFSTNLKMEYKGFDLEMFWQGVGKRVTEYDGQLQAPFYWIWWDPLEYFYNETWTAERSDAQWPRITPGGQGYDNIRNWNYRTSKLTLDNVSYIRLKLITLGYNLPKSLCSKIKMKEARIYLSGQDLLTFSKGTREGNYDPEDEKSAYETYPLNKVISVGLNVKF
ncbi:TonB-linked SusC/RagA family outer membrane protein [Arenibacter algicola]|uniref:TonB-linked SusC/RagA family outer membrane protein n=1 Tax=Arenibacter algicola TaxID=616991 RepID=A0ABY3AGZ6_9FLAO